MKKQYTNGEKIEYFTKKIERLQAYVEKLRSLPKDDFTGQNWNTSLHSQLSEARIRDMVRDLFEEALAKQGKRKAR